MILDSKTILQFATESETSSDLYHRHFTRFKSPKFSFQSSHFTFHISAYKVVQPSQSTMENQPHHPRQLTLQLQALSHEFQNIRDAMESAAQVSNSLRTEATRLNSAVVANDKQMVSLIQRLQRAESQLQRLLHQGASEPLSSPQNNHNLGFVGGPIPPPLPGFSQPSSYDGSRIDSSKPVAGSEKTGRNMPIRPPPDQMQMQKRSSAKNDNVHSLPMVIEKILEGKNYFKDRRKVRPWRVLGTHRRRNYADGS